MLELKSVTWRNFMSYGDYDTTLDLDTLGQCLITGEVTDEDKSIIDGSSNPFQITKSNGAGKSTIVNAIQWGLFGRTMHTSSPGDKVVNYFTGKDCIVRIDFKSGDHIIRTRKSGGHNELHFVKDGIDKTLTSDTLSTSKNQQKELNKDFNLDWDVFCGSVFFTQYGKPWMEMAEPTRKKAIERVLHVDRFAYYAKNAKGKADSLDIQINSKRNTIEQLEGDIDRLKKSYDRQLEASKNYGQDKERRIKEALQAAIDEKKKRDDVKRPDLDSLKAKWLVVKKIEDRLDKIKNEQRGSLNREISRLEGTVEDLENKIKKWESKTGTVCNSCEQKVPDTHTAAKIEPIKEKLEEEQKKLKAKQDELAKVNQTIKSAEKSLEDKKPDMTVRTAEDLHQSYARHNAAMTRYKNDAAKIQGEENPHTKSMEDTTNAISENEESIKNLKKEIKQETFLNRHYFYIYKAYNDRTKIKSFVFQEHVPFINSRLRHYLDVFGLDIKIELTPALGITSNMWGYEFESGGERKRTDVAFMLAMFDFHEQMYGRQCNVLVLDEVDGRLDDDGIDSLISIIKEDLAPKVETVLIISHRNMMYDTFPRELKVSRTNRFSQIAEVF